MKRLILFVVVFFLATSAYAEISLSQEQFDNIDVITKEIKAKHVDFLGFTGPRTAIRVYGISEEEAIKELDKIDLDALKAEKEDKTKSAKKKDILEAIGLTEGDITKIKALP